MFNTDDVKGMIKHAGDTAPELLDMMNPDFKKRFDRAVNSLSKLLDEIRVQYSDANIYLDDDYVHLMLGHSHTKFKNSQNIDANRDLVAHTNHSMICKIGGGGW